jgi:intracellular sulfur oxidation DsrE/DsrF family protein
MWFTSSNLLKSYIVNVTLMALISVYSLMSQAQDGQFLAQLHAHTPEELASLLSKAENWAANKSAYPEHPIAIVLHGPEANVFIKENYSKYKNLVDQAAKLDAFKVVDIKICERWMGFNNVKRNQLPPFLDTVPFGPAEEKRLIKAGYQSF